MPLKKSEPMAIGEILEAVLKNLNCEQTFKVYPLWKKWKEIVGEPIAARTRPDFIKENILYISVDHPVWMTELIGEKESLLSKINSFPFVQERLLLSDIRFRLKR